MDANNFVGPAEGGGFVVYVNGQNIGTYPDQASAENAFNAAQGGGQTRPNNPGSVTNTYNLPGAGGDMSIAPISLMEREYYDKRLQMLEIPEFQALDERDRINMGVQAALDYGKQIGYVIDPKKFMAYLGLHGSFADAADIANMRQQVVNASGGMPQWQNASDSDIIHKYIELTGTNDPLSRKALGADVTLQSMITGPTTQRLLFQAQQQANPTIFNRQVSPAPTAPAQAPALAGTSSPPWTPIAAPANTAQTAATSPAMGGTVQLGSPEYHGLIQQVAQQYGLDPRLLHAVMMQESGGNPNAQSPAGAQGLMQLMPGTAAGLGVTNPFDPMESLRGGANYLSQQLARFGTVPLALAAYNAGPGAVQQYGSVPPFEETQRYVNNILAQLGGMAA